MRLGGIRLALVLAVLASVVVLELGLLEHGVALPMLDRVVVRTTPGTILLASRPSLLLFGRFRSNGTG